MEMEKELEQFQHEAQRLKVGRNGASCRSPWSCAPSQYGSPPKGAAL